MLSPDRIHNVDPLSRDAADYEIVRRAIAFVSERWRAQPEIEAIAAAAGVSAGDLHHLFRRWAGITPKAFLQALTLDHARRLLRDSASVLDASFEVGLSGPGTAARSLRHPRSDVAGGMEIRRRRADRILRLSPLPVRHRAGDDDRARTCGARLRRSRRGTGRARRHAKPLADGQYRRGLRRHGAARSTHLRSQLVARQPAVAHRAHRHRFRGAGVGDPARNSAGPGDDLFRHRREARGEPRPRAPWALRSARIRSPSWCLATGCWARAATSPAITGASPASAPCWAGRPARVTAG